AGMFLSASWRDGPYLARFQGIVTNTVLALEFRSGNKLLDTVGAHDIAEMGIPEFCRTNPLLLFLHPTPGFHGNANGPFDIFVRDLIVTRIKQFEQAADRFVHRIGIPPRQRATKKHPVLDQADPALIAQLAPALG